MKSDKIGQENRTSDFLAWVSGLVSVFASDLRGAEQPILNSKWKIGNRTPLSKKGLSDLLIFPFPYNPIPGRAYGFSPAVGHRKEGLWRFFSEREVMQMSPVPVREIALECLKQWLDDCMAAHATPIALLALGHDEKPLVFGTENHGPTDADLGALVGQAALSLMHITNG